MFFKFNRHYPQLRATLHPRLYSHFPISKMTSSPSKVLVFGAGNFGSALSDSLSRSGSSVLLWSRDVELVKHFQVHQRNPFYLKDHTFSSNITAIGPELPSRELLSEVGVLLFAIPTTYVWALFISRESLMLSAETLENLRPSIDQESLPLLIFVNKGIEIGTHALSLEIIADTLGKEAAFKATFISGPSFAHEIVKQLPTSVSVASFSEYHAKKASEVFHQPWFRCYTGTDPIGLEIAGAAKNIYAIAAGACDGLGFENNTRAMLITRGLSEMTCIGTAYGASALTFLGLAGVGSIYLILFSSSPASRNYKVGFRLGQGEKLKDIIKTLGSVAEGVTTSKGMKSIIDELGIDAPIASMVYRVLYEDKPIRDAVEELMRLPPSAELDLSTISQSGRRENLLRKLGLNTAITP